MAHVDKARAWTSAFRLVNGVIVGVTEQIAALGLEPKELFVLSEIDEHPNPAAVADALCMPKPSVTMYLKRLESAGFVKREIDPTDLRRHRLTVTPAGREVLSRGLSLLSDAFGTRLEALSAKQQADFVALLDALA